METRRVCFPASKSLSFCLDELKVEVQLLARVPRVTKKVGSASRELLFFSHYNF